LRKILLDNNYENISLRYMLCWSKNYILVIKDIKGNWWTV